MAYRDQLFRPRLSHGERFWLGTINRESISQISPVSSERLISSHTLISLQSVIAKFVLTSCHTYERMEDRRRQEYIASLSTVSLQPRTLLTAQRIHRMSSFPLTLTKRQQRPRRRTLPYVTVPQLRQSYITRFLPSVLPSATPRRPSIRRTEPRRPAPLRDLCQLKLNMPLLTLNSINQQRPLLLARRRVRRAEKRKKRKRKHNREQKRTLRERIHSQVHRGNLATEPIDPGG